MAFQISQETADTIRNVLNDAVSSGVPKLPNYAAAIINREGDLIFNDVAGVVGTDKPDIPLKTDDLHWFASATKISTIVAAYQLIEQGKLDLDDEDIVERLVPEIADLPVLKEFDKDGKPVLEKKVKKITPKILISHTAGFAYRLLDDRIFRLLPEDHFETSGLVKDLAVPLLFQPGTDWVYGTAIDWLGIVIECITGMKLNDYNQKNIFQPLDIKDVTAYPLGPLQDRFVSQHIRDKASGAHITVPQHYTMHVTTEEAQTLGGGSLWGSPAEYVKLLAMILNNGTGPKTGAQILKPETIRTMLSQEVPMYKKTKHPGMRTPQPILANVIDDFVMPGMEGKERAWGYAGVLEKEGRKAPSQGAAAGKTGDPDAEDTIVWWAGIQNTYWWVDRKNGVAGVVGGQVLPFWEPGELEVWRKIMNAVYDGKV
ncbi:beta-lactamase/transpeptidase-like protein [Rhizodiscina lignyota]|uniref:Beta-lactamase/transpeptidase-like protein n=1 Tax=Rhizodiscina lignyota TaxID=1504668 RepID=A0A9P4I8N4_9PEZI|nr:beta-lactamase/transpeptidase-like protein [Rhizodiscina lignyota]